jgi:hypothetical protein
MMWHMASEQPGDRSQSLLTVLTTEHYTLQMVRSSTIAESTGRVGHYLTVLSGTVIALGLLAGIAEPFVAGLAGLALLATVYFIGLATFLRVLESGVEDLRALYGINRIRHAYGELEPAARRLSVMSDHDDAAGIARNLGIPRQLRGQLLLSAGGVVLVVNAVVGAAIITRHRPHRLRYSDCNCGWPFGRRPFVWSRVPIPTALVGHGLSDIEVLFPTPR